MKNPKITLPLALSVSAALLLTVSLDASAANAEHNFNRSVFSNL